MKKVILIACLSGLFLTATAQTQQPQRKLPPVVKLSVTDVEYIALMNKLDSAVMLLQNSDIPSNQLRDFTKRVNVAIFPFNRQLQGQLVLVDSVKVAPVAKKGKGVK